MQIDFVISTLCLGLIDDDDDYDEGDVVDFFVDDDGGSSSGNFYLKIHNEILCTQAHLH